MEVEVFTKFKKNLEGDIRSR